jgi:hypothetical protein
MGMLEKSPLEFVRSMNEVYKATDKGSQQARYLEGVFESLGMRWALGNDSLNEYTAGILDASGNIKKLGPGLQDAANKMYSLNLTMDEQIERAKDLFETKLIGIAGKEIRAFVNRSRGAYASLGNVIGDLASDQGPLGMMVTKLVAVRKIGLSALLPTVGAFGDIIIDTVTNMAPLLTAMGSMGFKFTDLLAPLTGANKLFLGIPGALLGTIGPFAAVAGAVALLGRTFKDGAGPISALSATFDALPESMMRTLNWLGGDKWDKKVWESFRTLSSEDQMKQVKKSGKKLAKGLWKGFKVNFFAGVDLLKGWAVDAGTALWENRGAVSEALTGAWSWAVETAWPVVKEKAVELWETAKTAVAEVDWAAMGTGISEALGSAWKWAVETAWPVVKRKYQWLWAQAVGFAEDMDFAGIARGVWRFVVDGFWTAVGKAEQLGKVVLAAVGNAWDWLVANKSMLADKFISGAKTVVGVVGSALGKAFDALGSGAALGTGWLLSVVDFMGSIVEKAVEALSETNIVAIAGKVSAFMEGVFDAGFTGLTGYVVKDDDLLTPMEQAVKNLGSGVKRIAGALYEVLAQVIGDMWEYAGTKFSEWWDDPMKSMFEKVGEAFPRIIKAVGIGLLFSSALRSALMGGITLAIKGLALGRVLGAIRGVGAIPPAGVPPPGAPPVPWYNSPLSAGKAGVGLAAGAVMGTGAGKAVGGWGSRVAGRMGPAMNWGMTGMMAGQVMQGMARPGEGMDIAGGFVSDVAGGASAGAMVGGPWGAVIGGALGASKALFQLSDKISERTERERRELALVAGSKFADKFNEKFERFTEAFDEGVAAFDAIVAGVEAREATHLAKAAEIMGRYNEMNTAFELQKSGVDSVIAGLDRYVSGDSVLSKGQVDAITGAMNMLREAGSITAGQFQTFVTSGSLTGMKEQVDSVRAALESQATILKDADVQYVEKLRFETAKLEAETTRGKIKADKEKKRIEDAGAYVETAKGQVAAIGQTKAGLETDGGKTAVGTLEMNAKMLRLGKRAQAVLAGVGGASINDADSKELRDYIAESGKSTAYMLNKLGDVKTLREMTEQSVKATAELKGIMVSSGAEQIAAFKTLIDEKMGAGQILDMAELNGAIDTASTSAQDLLTWSQNLATEASIAYDAAVGTMDEALDEFNKTTTTAAEERTRLVDEGLKAGVAAQKVIDAQIASQKAQEKFNQDHALLLGAYKLGVSGMVDETGKYVASMHRAFRVQEATAAGAQALAYANSYSELLGPKALESLKRDIGLAANKAIETEGSNAFKLVDEAVRKSRKSDSGASVALPSMMPSKATGGVVDMPKSGGVAMLHGRELVYPFDAKPSAEAVAGLREVLGQSSNRPSIQAAPPVKSAREAIQITVDNEEANRELIQVLRDELGAVRKLLSADKRYVLVDGKGSKVGAVQERSRSAALAG